ncbi:[protein ADP-ribosylarginine] hydrolase [Acrasis kona]|uniref:ADP-ribosylhydrolase ARH1 n=1 Tax=Acrasis kona TaxID=1008807 RepID=A0AAW2ZQY0_9EUKA
MTKPVSERRLASMLLAASGDAIGFNHGRWEFCKSGQKIHSEVEAMGGLTKIAPNPKKFIVSDDTVMHLATARALVDPTSTTFTNLMNNMAKEYVISMDDMNGRAPGPKCIQSCYRIEKDPSLWSTLPYDKAGGGCGGSMRSMCIGLKYFGEENRRDLIRASIESGRITHNCVVGFMGAFVSAAFTALAMEQIPPRRWGYILINDLFPQCMSYLKDDAKRDFEVIWGDMEKFKDTFKTYLKERQIENDGDSKPVFPENYGIQERDLYYKKWSYQGWAGASGDDSVIISYDALLGSEGNYLELANRAVFHYGDNDSTGTIAMAWYGALYGFPDEKFKANWDTIEYKKELTELANQL